jgi:hypothetical protein
MKHFIRLWCEWDYGQDEVIFESETEATIWLKKAVDNVDGIDYFEDHVLGEDFENIFEMGLAGFRIIKLIPDIAYTKRPALKNNA